MIISVLLLKLHPKQISLYILPRWLSSLVFHRQECGSTMRAPQALWRAVWSPAVISAAGSAALLSTVLWKEVSTTFPLPETVGLWLELALWRTGIERFFRKEEVHQLMLKASFLKLDLLAQQSFRESSPLPPQNKKTFLREAVKYYLADYFHIRGIFYGDFPELLEKNTCMEM